MVANSLVTNNFLENIFFCVQQKQEYHKGLKQLESE